jgi:hypothetical protein
MAISDQQMWASIFDYLYDALTLGPSGIGGGAGYRLAGADSILQMALPGLPVDASAYADAWTPSNPSGTMAAAENFSRLVDVIPNMGRVFDGSSKGRIEKIYGEEVVNASVEPPPEDPAKRAAYDKAVDLLFVDGTDYDNLGKPIKVKVASPLYASYETKRAAYDAAVTAYMTSYLQYDLTKAADQRSWAILAPRLIRPVDIAWQELQAAHPGAVETALRTLGRDEASSLARRFSDAKMEYELTKRQSIYEPGATWHWAQATPANWFSPSAAGSPVTIRSDRSYSSTNVQTSSWHAGAEYRPGLFSIGAGGSSTRTHVISDSSNLRIAFQMSRVGIFRPWLDQTLLSLAGWSVPGRAQGAYSNGRLDASNTGVFSLIPTAFITASHIQITADWGHSDLETIANHAHAGGGLSIGPFSIGGGGSVASQSSRYASAFDGRTLSPPGMQIIAWISQLVPVSPPLAG